MATSKNRSARWWLFVAIVFAAMAWALEVPLWLFPAVAVVYLAVLWAMTRKPTG